MDKDEAREILAGVIAGLRERSYGQLRKLLDASEMREATGRAGATYQIEVQSFWDDAPAGNLRVTAAIDDGGLSAFKPLSDDFIIAPDGSFVGE